MSEQGESVTLQAQLRKEGVETLLRAADHRNQLKVLKEQKAFQVLINERYLGSEFEKLREQDERSNSELKFTPELDEGVRIQ